MINGGLSLKPFYLLILLNDYLSVVTIVCSTEGIYNTRTYIFDHRLNA